MVGGRRIDVDDAASHRDLAPGFDLVLAAIAEGDESGDELVPVELHPGSDGDGVDVFDVGAEPLYEGAHRCHDDRRELVATGPQPPDDAQPASHRLCGGRYPFEREHLPRGEELDVRVTEELCEVAREPLGLDARRNRDQHRATSGGAGQGRREQGPGRFGDRDRARRTPGRSGHDRVGGQQRRE